MYSRPGPPARRHIQELLRNSRRVLRLRANLATKVNGDSLKCVALHAESLVDVVEVVQLKKSTLSQGDS